MTPLELFVGRAGEIRAFEKLLAPDAARWVMLVTGLSGTGKSLLIDWLRQHRCAGVRHAKVQLTPNTTAPDFLRLLAAQLDEGFETALGERLDVLDKVERRGPLVQVSPTMTMESKLGGRIDDAVQTSNTVVNLESATEMEALERETRRLDALVSVIRPLGADPWVLFVDESEHLEDRNFCRFLLERLVPRLRSRFPGFRFCLSGQSLPERASFGPHERVRVELGELNAEETAQLLKRAGVDDAAVQRRVMELTAGHPLLLGMLIEDCCLEAEALEERGEVTLPDRLDQGAVTTWIYGRILDRLPEAVRPIAADLALFDWFDLSILRASFGLNLEEATFRDLSRRSFVKAIGPGQWRCHDIVRRSLAAARRAADPEAAAGLCASAAEAFLQQMRARGEREGQSFFAGRLDYVRGALRGASGFSAARALDLMVGEFLEASAGQTNDYLFGLTHMMRGEDLPQAVRDFGEETRRFLERLNAEQADAWTVAFAERLAADAQRLGNNDTQEMYQVIAQGLAQQCGEWQTAVRLARALVQQHPKLDHRLLLSRTLASAGAAEEARQLLETVRAESGDTAEVLTGFGVVELIAQDTDRAQRFLADAIASEPEGAVQARLHLARILFAADCDEEALVQVDRLLEIAPGHDAGQRLRLDILAWLGRYNSMAPAEGQAAALIRESEDQIAELLVGDDPRRVLGAIAEDAAAVPVPLLLSAGEIAAARGQAEELERIHAVLLARAPEAKDLTDLQRLTQLLATGQATQAIREAEEVLARCPDLPGPYFVLSRIYEELGRHCESRELLGRLAERFPSLADQADQAIAGSHLAEGAAEAALDYLSRRAEEGALGARANVLRAVILSRNGHLDEACDVLERVVATTGRDQLSASGMISARRLFGILSAASGAADQASAAATALTELFPGVPMATVAALEIYGSLRDDRAVRAIAARTGEDAPLTVRVAVLGELGKLAFRHHRGSAAALLDALKREPERTDLATAVLLACQGASAQEAAELAAQAFRLAPRTLVEIQRLSTEAMVADPRLRETVMAMRARQDVPPLTRLGLDVALATHGYLRLDDARRDLQEIARQLPHMAAAVRVAEANLLLELDEPDEAGTVLAPFLEPGAMVEQAVVPSMLYLKRLGDWEAAVDLLEEAVAAFPADRLALLELRADLLIEHDPARALQSLEALRDEERLTAGLSMSLANALGTLGRHDEAIAVVAEALTDPGLDDVERATALRLLGRWQREAGRLDEAVESFSAAAALQPRQAAPLLGLARALEAAERWSEAYAALRDAVALEPQRLVALEQDLQRLRRQIDAAEARQALPSRPPVAAESAP